ncbi:hypothetical protein HYPSUDRAFT_71075 [Hypholoma sublateritium FD-334 SS-4]|uniref:CxC2-like cysteine cluster KDZ transposase-associated domain-containing protein n=1 Tax=Hypholoma sublateritium (strain FD-334 SS-4) TaxID=945553 RepID=A0A0D2NCI3_HYPSF|nr:hypothetical protein HYPSUDRAFT_71075 [Hypholoma sublateritium FD-334 SS-4]
MSFQILASDELWPSLQVSFNSHHPKMASKRPSGEPPDAEPAKRWRNNQPAFCKACPRNAMARTRNTAGLILGTTIETSRITTVARSNNGRFRAAQLTERTHNTADSPTMSAIPAPINSAPANTELPDGVACVINIGDLIPTAKSKRKRGKRGTTQNKLVEWLTCRDLCLDELLRHDGPRTSTMGGKCVSCTAHDGTFRCRDCGHGTSIMCRECLITRHGELELHQVEKWNGRFFEKASLSQLGLSVQLGHEGAACPCPIPGPKGFMVFDLSGAHYLLCKKWFLATLIRPRTVFTFDLLDTFHKLSLQGKGNLFNFYHTILCKTDNPGIEKTIYQYPEIHRTFRIWQNLMSMKRAGRGQDPSGVNGTPQGRLMVKCPACPHLGKNLPPGWDKSRPMMFLYIMYLAVDANFKLKGKDRKIKDVELMPGMAIFVNKDKYQDHLENYIEQPEINTCESEHDTIVKAGVKATPGYSVSSAGLVLCSRHLLVRKNGVGDLQKGERYCNMDFIILSALVGLMLPRIIITYDIACQWSKNLASRMIEFPENMRINPQTIVDTVIPSWHINGHGEPCRQNFSLNYLKGARKTCGEEVEINWSHTNPLAPSVCEMGPAARHNTLNDHWNGWNFRQLVGFRSLLGRKLKDAARMSRKQEDVFNQLSSTFSLEVIEKWEKMVQKWEDDPTAPNLYAEPRSTTTLQDVCLDLAKEDTLQAQGGQTSPTTVSLTGFFTTAFELEDRQYLIKTEPQTAAKKVRRSTKRKVDIQDKQMILLQQINNWRQVQLVYTPYVAMLTINNLQADENGQLRVQDVAGIPLHLPSTFPSHIQEQEDMKVIFNKERRLRERVIQGLWQFKKINISGTGNRPNTRMVTLYKRIQQKIQQHAHRYRKARAALISLDPNGPWCEWLKDLQTEDIRGPGKDPEDNSNSRYEPSWIWLVSRTQSATQDEVEFHESMRVEWAKTRARVMRWQEEYQIVPEEMRRVLAWYEWKAEWWEMQAGRRKEGDQSILIGVSAYAHKQAHIVRRMAARCAADWLPILTKLGITPCWASRYPVEPSPEGSDEESDDDDDDDDDEDFN